jgi:hypothetical protein
MIIDSQILHLNHTIGDIPSPPFTLIMHGLSNFHETWGSASNARAERTANVGTSNEGRKSPRRSLGIFDSSLETNVERIFHDLCQFRVNFLRSPSNALAVLSHLQARNRNTTTIRSLSGAVPDPFFVRFRTVRWGGYPCGWR